MNAAISPCVGICRLDDGTGYCVGCGRTSDEIATWSTAGPGGRRAVWAALPARLISLGVTVRRLPWGPADARGFVLRTLREARGRWLLAAPGASAAFPCPVPATGEIRSHGDIIEAIGAGMAIRLHCGFEARAFAVDGGAGRPGGPESIVLAIQANRPQPPPWKTAPHGDEEAVRPADRGTFLRVMDVDQHGAFWGLRQASSPAAVVGGAPAGGIGAGDAAGDVVIATALGRIEVPLGLAGLGAPADAAPALPESFIAAACFEPEL
mgnify:CR=1 FL=1